MITSNLRHLIWVLLLVSCDQAKVVEHLSDHESIKYEVDSEGRKHGLYEKFVAEQLVESAHYRRDTLHGLRSLYFPTGSKEVEEHYTDGAFDGPYKTFYKNGQLRLLGNYASNEMQGIWRQYDTLGQLIEEVEMHDNQENGRFVEYYSNGNLKAEGFYLNGNFEHDTLKLYNEAGTLYRVMLCNKGLCKTIWQDEALKPKL